MFAPNLGVDSPLPSTPHREILDVPLSEVAVIRSPYSLEGGGAIYFNSMFFGKLEATVDLTYFLLTSTAVTDLVVVTLAPVSRQPRPTKLRPANVVKLENE